MDRKIFFLVALFFISFASSQLTNIYNDCEIYGNCFEIIEFDNETAFVNITDFWSTNLGFLGDVDATQFDNVGGTLTIDPTFLNTDFLRLDGTNTPSANYLWSTALATTSTGRFDSGIIDTTSVLSVDSESRVLDDSFGSTSVNWGARVLEDGSSVTSVDWSNRQLSDSSGTPLVDWASLILSDTSATTSVDWSTRVLIDSASTNSVDWSGRVLIDSSSITSIDWLNRQLSDSSSTVLVDWASLLLIDTSAVTSVDWSNRLLSDSGGTTTVDYGFLTLSDSSAVVSVDWSNRQLSDSGGTTTVDYGFLTLSDGSAVVSVDWSNRQLLASDADLILDWSTSGTAQFDNSNIITTGTLGSGKATISAAGIALDVQNTVDAASNQVAILRPGNRATPTNGDEGFISLFNDDSTGTQVEFGRLTWVAGDVSNVGKDGRFIISLMRSNTLRNLFQITEGSTKFNEDSVNQDFIIESNNDNSMFVVDGGQNRIGISNNVPRAFFDIDGRADEIQILIEGHSTQTNDMVVIRNFTGNDILTVSNDLTTFIAQNTAYDDVISLTARGNSFDSANILFENAGGFAIGRIGGDSSGGNDFFLSAFGGFGVRIGTAVIDGLDTNLAFSINSTGVIARDNVFANQNLTVGDTLIVNGNITMVSDSNVTISTNATCTVIYSPDGTTEFRVCNA